MMTEPQAFNWGSPTTPVGTGIGALGNGVGAITFSAWFPANDADEISLMIVPNYGDATAMTLAVQWNEFVNAAIQMYTPVWDSFMNPSTAGTDNTITTFRNLWSMPSTQLPFNLLLPVSASFVRVGAFSNGAPNAGTGLQVLLQRQRTYGTQR